MDNFMDKLAQKFNAQEMIKANSEAETNEMKKLKLQIAEYEKILQEMRKLNYKNTEISENIAASIGENAEKIQEIKEDEQKLISLLRDITDEQTRNMESEHEQREEDRLEREKESETKKETDKTTLEELSKLLELKFQNSDDFNHKENVKVYRNVQAVVVDELKRYNDQRLEENKALNKKANASICVGVIATVASVCNVAIWVVVILLATGIIR
jgi:chromosome segregation ATPase